MIKYKLLCKECDLKFDSWFASSNEYERLKKKKLLNCHKCNSFNVEKTIMAPGTFLTLGNNVKSLPRLNISLTKLLAVPNVSKRPVNVYARI